MFFWEVVFPPTTNDNQRNTFIINSKHFILCQSLLNRTLTLWGGGKALPPLEFFWEVFLYKMGPPKCFCMFSSKFVVLKKILGFSTFVVAEIFWVKNWKILKFWPFPKTLFFTTKIFFFKKKFLVVKNRVFGNAKISKFFNFWPKIFQQQEMLKTLKFFSKLQIYSKTCKKILADPSWIKIPLRKNPGGKGPSPPRPQRVNVRFKRDWHKMY